MLIQQILSHSDSSNDDNDSNCRISDSNSTKQHRLNKMSNESSTCTSEKSKQENEDKNANEKSIDQDIYVVTLQTWCMNAKKEAQFSIIKAYTHLIDANKHAKRLFLSRARIKGIDISEEHIELPIHGEFYQSTNDYDDYDEKDKEVDVISVHKSTLKTK